MWALGYEARSSEWRRGTSTSDIRERARGVLAYLSARGFVERPICFVAHSMGGVLVKELLRQAHDVAPRFRPVADRVVGVAFLATPHDGAGLARLFQRLPFVRPSQALRDLALDSPHLRELRAWYGRHVRDRQIQHLVLHETVRTRGRLIVERHSADPGIDGVVPLPMTATHGGIARPVGRDDPVFVQVEAFLRGLLRSLPPALPLTIEDGGAVEIAVTKPAGLKWGRNRYSDLEPWLSSPITEGDRAGSWVYAFEGAVPFVENGRVEIVIRTDRDYPQESAKIRPNGTFATVIHLHESRPPMVLEVSVVTPAGPIASHQATVTP